MYEVYERKGTGVTQNADDRIVLTHEQRTRGRLRTSTTSGEEVRLFLERGQPLLVGETLISQCGRQLVVEGAVEDVTLGRCQDWHIFARACYHLGNRHVKVEVGECWLKMSPDHVLEDMLTGLGLQLEHVRDVFVPESGAYSHGHHHH